MIHNYDQKKMLTAPLFRHVGWLGLIAMLGLGLLCPPFIQESAGQKKQKQRQTQETQTGQQTQMEAVKSQKKLEAEKMNGEIKVNPALMNGGTLRGKINLYQQNKNLSEVINRGCFDSSNRILSGMMTRVGINIPMTDRWGQTGSTTVKANCDGYEFKNLPPGTYVIGPLLANNYPINEFCNPDTNSCPDVALNGYYYPLLAAYMTVPRNICAPVLGGDPMCRWYRTKTVTITKGKTTTVDLSVLVDAGVGHYYGG